MEGMEREAMRCGGQRVERAGMKGMVRSYQYREEERGEWWKGGDGGQLKEGGERDGGYQKGGSNGGWGER